MDPVYAEQKRIEEHKVFVDSQKVRAHKRLAERKEKEEEEQAKQAKKQRIEQRKLEQKQKEIEAEEEAARKKEHWMQQQKLREQQALENTLSASRAVCDKIAYIRPQRTAGTTLGEVIMPHMTQKYNQTQINTYHMESRWALATAPNCMVASLRDPVERFMSEYSMFKESSGTLELDEWDFHTDDMPWVGQMKSRPVADGLQEYMSYPGNPTFNRQALYLLGFERVACSDRCCGICSRGSPGYPAHEYDWHGHYDELLAKGKEALRSLRAFTVAECFPESMRAVAMSVGWDPDETEEMARSTHSAFRRNETALSEMAQGFRMLKKAPVIKDWAQLNWTRVVPKDMKAVIRKKNEVDVELVLYAKQLLYERHGINC